MLRLELIWLFRPFSGSFQIQKIGKGFKSVFHFKFIMEYGKPSGYACFGDFGTMLRPGKTFQHEISWRQAQEEAIAIRKAMEEQS